jgi:hypothetical protein
MLPGRAPVAAHGTRVLQGQVSTFSFIHTPRLESVSSVPDAETDTTHFFH